MTAKKLTVSSVRTLKKQLKTQGYNTRQLMGSKHNFYVVSHSRFDKTCVICKHTIAKGTVHYGRTVSVESLLHVDSRNPWAYFGFALCSEQCVEAAIVKMQNGYQLTNFLFDDEHARELIMQMHKESEQLQKIIAIEDEYGFKHPSQRTFHNVKFSNELNDAYCPKCRSDHLKSEGESWQCLLCGKHFHK